jgi:hypothetical protein
MNIIPEIPGAEDVVAWFGGWPSFHDAEVLEFTFVRKGTSFLRIHTWLMTDQVDEKGYYVLDKHAIVTFTFERVTDLELRGFNHQNVISGLQFERTADSFILSLEPCYGVGGAIEATKMSVSLQPGKPTPTGATRDGRSIGTGS